MRRVLAVAAVALASASAHAEPAGAVGSPGSADPHETVHASTIAHGLDQPGAFSPANAFDGNPDTMYCAPPGERAHVSVQLSAADAAALEHVAAIEIDASDAGLRTIKLRVLYRQPGASQFQVVTGTFDEGATRLAFTRADKRGAQEIDLEIAAAAPPATPPSRGAHPPAASACIGELTFVGPDGPLHLPDLDAMVDRDRARDAKLAAALADKHAFVAAYLSAFGWLERNPNKKTSTWESAIYQFAADGTFTRTYTDRASFDPTHPIIEPGTWTIGRDGALHLGSAAIPLAPCRAHGGYLCATRVDLTPIPAL